MKTNAYSLFDAKAAVFGVPFFMPRDGMAVRALTDLVNDVNTMVGKHPEDFTLFKVAEFDDATGEVIPVTPVAVMTAASLVRFENGKVATVGQIRDAFDIKKVNSSSEVR